MSEQHFDELSKALAAGTSRRAALRKVAGGGVKGLLVGLGLLGAGSLRARGADAAPTGHLCCTYNCTTSGGGLHVRHACLDRRRYKACSQFTPSFSGECHPAGRQIVDSCSQCPRP